MNNKKSIHAGYAGDEAVIAKAVDLSVLDVKFSSKPLVVGGLAMEYYGIRTRGEDIDFIVTNADYEALAKRYPEYTKDKWGDLFVSVGHCELLRSIFRFDYHFFSAGATEYESCRVISIEKLFFMKVLARDNQPDIEKHVADYRLMWNFMQEIFQNKAYVAQAEEHLNDYLNAPDGTIRGGNYQ